MTKKNKKTLTRTKVSKAKMDSHFQNQTEPDHSDAAVSFPVVGVGASAGGLDAFREFLKFLPTDTGMAFVLVQHLDPHHSSMLTALLADSTPMPVSEVAGNMNVEPNHVYVIPPNFNLGILHDTLQLVTRHDEENRFLPVDWFMRTLAEDRGGNAIGVILSGTASDGTLGMKQIKAEGGITFAQAEISAEYFGMPGSAIAAGCVDFVLTAREIAREIGRIARHPYLLHERSEASLNGAEDELNKVFLVLRSRTGQDFTYYKHTTIKRRIKRRMLVHKLDHLTEYVHLLERHPPEVDALFQDILINVTAFFRDTKVFDALPKVVFPKLLEKRPAGASLRIWVPGCATGEEAYSLAMILLEYLGERANTVPIQIFATDIDGLAIEKARQGLFPERIVEEVSAKRLKRFFNKVSGGYQISKAVRDLCIFAEQNVSKDPPFSRLDMVSCRNMLIYMGSVLQKKVLQIFHYALQPSGFLLLGTSETIGSHAELFRMLDKKNKIYTKKSAVLPINYEFTPTVFYNDNRMVSSQQSSEPITVFDLNQEADRIVLNRFAPPGVVINHDMDILHFRGETGPYLNPTPGSASLNLLKMARKELVVELRAAIHKVFKEGKPLIKKNILMKANEISYTVDIQIIPLTSVDVEDRSLLVLFEATEPVNTDAIEIEPAKLIAAEQNRIEALEQELNSSREYLQSIIEDQEAGNEELKSANEEIQSTNEELQSTNEELETAKEELQSTNEELATVNDELENRALQLSVVNNDLTNLLANVNLPILMLDEDLRIRQFTRPAEQLLNLIESDLGRPIGQIRPNLEIPDLEKQVTDVIDNMMPKSLELQDRNGCWYNIKMRPYKTMDNRIEGIVITFLDINDIKDAKRLRVMHEKLQEREQLLRSVIDNAATVFCLKDSHGCYQMVNHRFESIMGVEQEKIIGKTDQELFPGFYADREQASDAQVLVSNVPMKFEGGVFYNDAEHVYLSIKFPVSSLDGRHTSVACIATDITQQKADQEGLRRLDSVLKDASDAITMQGLDGNIRAWNPAAEQLYGWSEAEALQMNVRNLVVDKDHAELTAMLGLLEKKQIPEPAQVARVHKNGNVFTVQLKVSLLIDHMGSPTGFSTTERFVPDA